MQPIIYNAKIVLQALETYPRVKRYWLAYSGGLDSTVLLHTLAMLRDGIVTDLQVVHVDHRLSQQHLDWVGHAQRQCEALSVALHVLTIYTNCPSGESLEAWAREERYRLLGEQLARGDLLFTAHHANDQAETLLLQLFRGAGPHGLAAMPQIKRRQHFWHARPLLNVPRSALQAYAQQYALSWVEDDSNHDLKHDRNYLRQQCIKPIIKRWPAVIRSLNRSAKHQSDVMSLINELAEIDLKNVITEQHTLNIGKLKTLSIARIKNVLRCWLRFLKLPSAMDRHLEMVMNQMIFAAHTNSLASVRWPGAQICYYRGNLYGFPPLPKHHTDPIVWDFPEKLVLPSGGILTAKQGKGLGLKVEKLNHCQLEIRYRRGGESFRLPNRRHHTMLKKLFQARQIPAWLRGYIPLLFVDGVLAAIPSLWITADFISTADETAWLISWAGHAYPLDLDKHDNC